MNHETATTDDRILDRISIRSSLRKIVYSLTLMLGFSLLATGLIAIIAAMKGTWHWQIHLESMISHMAVFVIAILVVLVPLYVLLFVARVRGSR